MKLYRRPGSEIWWVYHRARGKTRRRSMRTTDKQVAEERAQKWVKHVEDSVGRKKGVVMLSRAIEKYLDHCRSYDLSKLTLQGYTSRLKIFLSRSGDDDISGWMFDDAFDKVFEHLESRQHEVESTKHDRVALSAFFNFAKSKRWYTGENPAGAKLHQLRKPRKKFKRPKRCMTSEEDLILRREGPRDRAWPVLLLTRWAGLRRGEACSLQWCDIDLEEGFLDVVGRDYGKKHPRRVWLKPWIVLQLRTLRPQWLPVDNDWPLWPFHPNKATDDLNGFCDRHLTRRVDFNTLRASFTTESFASGLTPLQESMLVGHSPEVAQKHYSEYEAREAITKLPDDPLLSAPDVDQDDVDGEEPKRLAQ